MTDTKTAYVVYTTSDLTEGRTADYPMCVCETKATAIRMAKGKYVQGSNCPIKETVIERRGRDWWGPVQVIPPTETDAAMQAKINKYDEAVAKAKAAGLTEDDIAAISRR